MKSLNLTEFRFWLQVATPCVLVGCYKVSETSVPTYKTGGVTNQTTHYYPEKKSYVPSKCWQPLRLRGYVGTTYRLHDDTVEKETL